MDEGVEEEELDHADIIAQYSGFNDAAMGRDNEEEVAAEDGGAMMLLVMPSVIQKENVK